MVKAVVDTNILISGFLSIKGTPAQIIEAWIERQFMPIVSKEIKREYFLALQYKSIKTRLGTEFHAAKNTLQKIVKIAENINPKMKINFFSDPKDDMFVEAAIAGKTDFIITGDKAMLAMAAYEDIKIINAQEFLSCIR